ncbi:MAG: butyrate kinase [Eubacterium sp.]|jgi:butyrate kinase|nr:butyrate kinase [Eubacterium sp.]SEQ94507.1 butyrate kinase [Lachnospiraceae bacterium NE2001]
MIKSLIINPGSTSTKLGIFEDETLISEETLRHTTEEIAQFEKIVDQVDFRKEMILNFLQEKGEDLASFNVIVGRGGLLKPIPSGTYAVTDKLIEDLKIGVGGEHASNLGGILAKALADQVGVPSYIVDPVVVDELEPVARISGVPELPRVSIFHALNQKAVAKRYAKEVGKAYEDLNLIVVHMGGGVSVGAHTGGRIVDVFNALSGEGAFSPERAGGVAPAALVEMCFSGKYTKDEIKKKLIGNGGYNALVGTNNAQEVYKRSLTDPDVKLVFDAFIYQVSKDIGAMSTVLKGKVDQIILTGGIAYGEQVTADIKERVGFIAPVTIYPGEDELLALAQGALRVMNGEEEAREY